MVLANGAVYSHFAHVLFCLQRTSQKPSASVPVISPESQRSRSARRTISSEAPVFR